ncbi:SgcJ/EcaC family oxidoreductase [Salininema proteolyticum]|uniref:SgcJ/EcaC family oxidoreductase n=1 Tax=Salininema proteolyticum TaxID=1607685 RepID=A0ABV8U641_9ACTN
MRHEREGSERDRERVEAVLEGIARAWNSGDAEAYAAAFTEDADYITFFGRRFRGRREIEDSHRYLFEGPLKGSKMADEGETDVRMLSPDVALAVVTGGVEIDAGAGLPPDRESIVTFTAVRRDDRWLLSSFQNTRRDPAQGRPR